MLNWLKRIFFWIWRGKLLWLALIVLIICFFIAFFPEITETRIRLTGLVLQLCGISTVLISISELRKLFNHPTLFTIGKKWLMSFPPYCLPKIEGKLNTASGNISSFISGVVLQHRARPNATIEERVRVLESNRDNLEHITSELREQITQINRERNEYLLSERQKRERDITGLEIKLEVAETAGKYYSLIGLVWLLIGLIMSTASVEICRLF